jgi:hypothetical protein
MRWCKFTLSELGFSGMMLNNPVNPLNKYNRTFGKVFVDFRPNACAAIIRLFPWLMPRKNLGWSNIFYIYPQCTIATHQKANLPTLPKRLHTAILPPMPLYGQPPVVALQVPSLPPQALCHGKCGKQLSPEPA